MQLEEKSSVQLTLPYTVMDSYKHFKFFEHHNISVSSSSTAKSFLMLVFYCLSRCGQNNAALVLLLLWLYGSIKYILLVVGKYCRLPHYANSSMQANVPQPSSIYIRVTKQRLRDQVPQLSPYYCHLSRNPITHGRYSTPSLTPVPEPLASP